MTNTNQNVEIKLNDEMDINAINRNYKTFIHYTSLYFTELSIWWWIGLFISVIFTFVAALNEVWVFFAICAIALAGIIWMIVSYHDAKISDYTFDNILKKIKKKIEHNALDKLAISEGDFIRKPGEFDTPANSSSYKMGKDGKYRYSHRNINIFFFTQKYLARYECVLDLKTGSTLNERTEEFFYKDVVSIEVNTVSANLIVQKDKYDLESFATGVMSLCRQWDAKKYLTLRNSGGGCITVPIFTWGYSLVTENPDAIVNSIRSLLKDFKG